MKLFRLALVALAATSGCANHEPELEAAKSALEKQVQARADYVRGRGDIVQFRSDIRAWKTTALEDPDNRPLVPGPPLALRTPPPPPLVVPELPKARAFESDKAARLRAEIAELEKAARLLDRAVSDIESIKEFAWQELEEAQRRDSSIARAARHNPFRFAPADAGAPVDAGTMRRISP